MSSILGQKRKKKESNCLSSWCVRMPTLVGTLLSQAFPGETRRQTMATGDDDDDDGVRPLNIITLSLTRPQPLICASNWGGRCL